MTNKILLISFVFAINIYSQNLIFKGKIKEQQNGNPVENAVIFISQNIIGYSSVNGEFQFDELSPKKYIVTISHPSFKKLVDTLSLLQDETRDYFLHSSPIKLDEIIVSSSKIDRYLKNSPYSEVLITKDDILKKQHQSVAEVLTEQAGINLIRDGIWGTEISIRGLSRENVVTLIDGNRITTSTDIAARLSMFNINDIERIEVIKGASSSMYGSGATGGIVNVITKSPKLFERFTLTGNAATGYNSVNNLSLFSGTIYSGSNFWSSKLSGSYRKAQNTQTPAGELRNSQFEDYSLNGTLNIYPLHNHLLKIDYQLFKANDVGIPGASIFPSNADVRYPYEKREMISAGYEIQNISSVFYKLTAKYSFQVIERRVENIPYTVQNIPASGTSLARRVSVLKITPGADHKSNNFQLQGNFLLSEQNNLVVGIDYWDRNYIGNRERFQLIEMLNSQGNVVSTVNRIIGEKPLPNSKYSSLGLFAQDEMPLIDQKLMLSLGARYDRINISGEETYNPLYEINNGVINNSPAGQKIIWLESNSIDDAYSSNLGLKYEVNEQLNITLGLGLSFRSPSLEERFQYIDQGSFVRIGDPNLKSELSKSADFGIRYYGSRLKIISSIFFQNFENLVAEIPSTYEGRKAFIKTNIGEAHLYGFDLRTDLNFYNNINLYTTISYVKGDDLSANSNLPAIPPLNGIMGINFLLFDSINADFSTTFFAEQSKTAIGEIRTPGYAYFNFYLNSTLAKFNGFSLRIYTGIENIFNREYRNHLSTTRGSITVEPGRNLFIKLAADF